MSYISTTINAGLLLGSIIAHPVMADELHVALIKSVAGAVTVTRESGSRPALSGMRLYRTDRLVSGPGAAAGVVFKDGTVLSIGPSTDISIRDYSFEPKQNEFEFSLYLTRGTALYSSGKIGKIAPEAVDISTPRATVGVRGTRFVISAE